jgi:hypothetical protein
MVRNTLEGSEHVFIDSYLAKGASAHMVKRKLRQNYTASEIEARVFLGRLLFAVDTDIITAYAHSDDWQHPA